MELFWGLCIMPQKITFDKALLQEKMKSLYNEAMEAFEEENNTEDAYEKLLDETYGAVEICDLSYSAGMTLREVDPIAFRCGMVEESDRYYEQFEEENDIEDFRDEALEALNMEDES